MLSCSSVLPSSCNGPGLILARESHSSFFFPPLSICISLTPVILAKVRSLTEPTFSPFIFSSHPSYHFSSAFFLLPFTSFSSFFLTTKSLLYVMQVLKQANQEADIDIVALFFFFSPIFFKSVCLDLSKFFKWS